VARHRPGSGGGGKSSSISAGGGAGGVGGRVCSPKSENDTRSESGSCSCSGSVLANGSLARMAAFSEGHTRLKYTGSLNQEYGL